MREAQNMFRIPRLFVLGFFLLCAGTVPHVASAGQLSKISDYISESAPSASSTHTISFILETAVPPSGKIIVIPPSGASSIPGGFSVSDIDLSVAPTEGGIFTDRSLAASASATNDGVSIVSGSSGTVTFTLNSTTGLSAGNVVSIELGKNALYQATGTTNILNASTTGSFAVVVNTQNSSGGTLDTGQTRVVLLYPVGVSADVTATTPVLSNLQPSGLLPAGTVSVEFSLDTSMPATCGYSLSSTTPFASSTAFFPIRLNGNTTHTGIFVSGLSNGNSYTYFVICSSIYGNVSSSTPLTFQIGVVPQPASENTSTKHTTGGPFLKKAIVTMKGYASPLSRITVLRDGVAVTGGAPSVGNASGAFSAQIEGLERGTYTFSAYMTDTTNAISNIFNSTVSILSDSGNVTLNMLLSPAARVIKTDVGQNESLSVVGTAPPGARVHAYLGLKGQSFSDSLRDAGATSTATGFFAISVPTDELPSGIYELTTAYLLGTGEKSEASRPVYINIGRAAEPAPRTGDSRTLSDISGDGKVNIIDFSIMLSQWGKSGSSDINGDGSVGIADFSILIFNWTG